MAIVVASRLAVQFNLAQMDAMGKVEFTPSPSEAFTVAFVYLFSTDNMMQSILSRIGGGIRTLQGSIRPLVQQNVSLNLVAVPGHGYPQETDGRTPEGGGATEEQTSRGKAWCEAATNAGVWQRIR
eukprot:jgi/Picre1/33414/NNA_008738.t1